MISKKQISQILLGCFSVILCHQWIPHHHHSEVVPVEATDSCPVEHEDQDSPGEHPFHCHAFNELAFFKEDIADSLDKKPETEQLDLVMATTLTLTDLSFHGSLILLFQRSVVSDGHLNTLPPRGPPFQV